MPHDPLTEIRTFMQAVFGADFPGRSILANLSPPRFVRGSAVEGLDLTLDCYWSIASFKPSARTHALAGALDVRALVIDDVGTRISAGRVELALGPPTAAVETSSGNFQWVYRLTRPVDRDWDRVIDAVEKLIGAELHGKDAVHLFRLPVGVNTKPGRGGFPVRLAAPLMKDVALDPDSLVRDTPQSAPPGPSKTFMGHATGAGAVVDVALEPAPVWDIGRLVGMVKNPLGLDREAWVAIAHQIKRLAVNPYDGRAAWEEFSGRWEGGGANEAETARVWESLGDVSRTRGGLLIERARQDAGEDEFSGWVQAEASRAFDDGELPPDEGPEGGGAGGTSGSGGGAGGARHIDFSRDQQKTARAVLQAIGGTLKQVDGGGWREWNAATGLWDEYPGAHMLRVVERLAQARRRYPIDAKLAKVIGARTYLAGVSALAAISEDVIARMADFDRDPLLLGVPSGVIDLGAKITRRDVRAGRIGELVSRRCAVDPAPVGARGPVWARYLSEFTGGDAALEEWLQVYAGYALTGLTREHLMPFFYGGGGNGKSVFLTTLRWLWGDYGAVLDKGLLFEQQGTQHRAFLAMLYGKRLGIVADVPATAIWEAQLLKMLTGGDPITANWMRENPFTFTATCKLLVSGQNQPGVRSMDQGMRRRLRMLPLKSVPKKIDAALGDKLRGEGPEILRWCLDGLDLYWGLGGLPRSKAVERETDEYMNEQDLFGSWIAGCLRRLTDDEKKVQEDWGAAGDAKAAKARLRAADAFRSWDAFRCANSRRDADPVSVNVLSRRLTERGIKVGRDNQGAFLEGYKLVNSDDFNPF